MSYVIANVTSLFLFSHFNPDSNPKGIGVSVPIFEMKKLRFRSPKLSSHNQEVVNAT